MRMVLAAAAMALGCSGPSDSPTDDAATGDGGGSGLDLATAEWQLFAAGVVPGYCGGATLALAGDETVVAWSELDTENPVDERPAYAASSNADFAPERLTPESGADASSTRIASSPGGLHLVFSGAGSSGPSDIFYLQRTGETWSQAVDLTGSIEVGERRDSEPAILATGDQIVVVFLSAPADDSLSPGVHLVRFDEGTTPATVEVLIDSANADCEHVDAAAGDDGILHVVAQCLIGGATEIVYLNDRSGSFVAQSPSLGPGTDPRNPAIALGPDSSVHLVWDAEADCDGQMCRDVFHSRDLAPPISVTGRSQDGGGFAKAAVLPGGELVVVFHRIDSRDLYWTYAASGQSFVRVLQATAATPDTIEYFASDLVIDGDGRPHMAFIRDFVGSDPIQADVYAASLR